MLAFSIKRAIIPNIRSCRTLKEAWDTLATLYQARNEARVAYLHKQLEREHMNEGDSMDNFLTKIKDLKEQLIATNEVLSDSSERPTRFLSEFCFHSLFNDERQSKCLVI